MLIESINFSDLAEISLAQRWGEGNERQDRRLFKDEGLVYKVWSAKFKTHGYVCRNGNYEAYVPTRIGYRMPGFDLGFFDLRNSSGFVEYIVDEQDCLRGYVTSLGQRPSSITDQFVDQVWQKTVKSGFAHMDFCLNNVIDLPRGLSLIDLDTPFTELGTFNVEFERANGALRKHVESRYRDRLEEHIETTALAVKD